MLTPTVSHDVNWQLNLTNVQPWIRGKTKRALKYPSHWCQQSCPSNCRQRWREKEREQKQQEGEREKRDIFLRSSGEEGDVPEEIEERTTHTVLTHAPLLISLSLSLSLSLSQIWEREREREREREIKRGAWVKTVCVVRSSISSGTSPSSPLERRKISLFSRSPSCCFCSLSFSRHLCRQLLGQLCWHQCEGYFNALFVLPLIHGWTLVRFNCQLTSWLTVGVSMQLTNG